LILETHNLLVTGTFSSQQDTFLLQSTEQPFVKTSPPRSETIEQLSSGQPYNDEASTVVVAAVAIRSDEWQCPSAVTIQGDNGSDTDSPRRSVILQEVCARLVCCPCRVLVLGSSHRRHCTDLELCNDCSARRRTELPSVGVARSVQLPPPAVMFQRTRFRPAGVSQARIFLEFSQSDSVALVMLSFVHAAAPAQIPPLWHGSRRGDES
jgi:hypothetical protein